MYSLNTLQYKLCTFAQAAVIYFVFFSQAALMRQVLFYCLFAYCNSQVTLCIFAQTAVSRLRYVLFALTAINASKYVPFSRYIRSLHFFALHSAHCSKVVEFSHTSSRATRVHFVSAKFLYNNLIFFVQTFRANKRIRN